MTSVWQRVLNPHKVLFRNIIYRNMTNIDETKKSNGWYFPEIHGLGTQPGGFLALSTKGGRKIQVWCCSGCDIPVHISRYGGNEQKNHDREQAYA